MGRKAKFRALAQKMNTDGTMPEYEWVYYSTAIRGKQPDHALVDPDTECQFTGMFDKNGKEIYEGDILRWTNAEADKDFRDFVPEMTVRNFGQIESFFDDEWRDGDIYSNVEICGNIYENQELLNGSTSS